MKIAYTIPVTIELELPEDLAGQLHVNGGMVDVPEDFNAVKLDLLAQEVLDRLHPQLVGAEVMEAEWSTVCRVCGCTDQEACEGPCYWVEPDLCSDAHLVVDAGPAVAE